MASRPWLPGLARFTLWWLLGLARFVLWWLLGLARFALSMGHCAGDQAANDLCMIKAFHGLLHVEEAHQNFKRL